MSYPSLVRVYIFSDFLIHQEYIAEVLCINKDKPMLNCDGKCFLATQLKQAETQERDERHATLNKTAELSFFTVPKTIAFKFSSDEIEKDSEEPGYSFNEFGSMTHEIFHPPRI